MFGNFCNYTPIPTFTQVQSEKGRVTKKRMKDTAVRKSAQTPGPSGSAKIDSFSRFSDKKRLTGFRLFWLHYANKKFRFKSLKVITYQIIINIISC